MKTLILADIHANLAALEAVLEHEKSWDDIIFLGDAVIGGPNPNEVLELLSENKGIFVMGNHDYEALTIDLEKHFDDPSLAWMQWTGRVITESSKSFLKGFLSAYSAVCQGIEARLLHGVLRKEQGKRLLPDSPPEVFGELSKQFTEPYVFIAHSHVQFMKKVGYKVFINPGGLGQPRLGKVVAAYGVIKDGDIKLCSVPYDVEKTCRAMDALPLDKGFIEEWKDCFRHGVLPARYGLKDLSYLGKQGYV